MTPLHGGGIAVRGQQCGGNYSWSSTMVWWRTSDCYNTQEALEASKV